MLPAAGERVVARVVRNRSAAEYSREASAVRAAGGTLAAGFRTTTLPAILSANDAPEVIDYLSISLGAEVAEAEALIPFLRDGRWRLRALSLSVSTVNKTRELLHRHGGYSRAEDTLALEHGELWVEEGLRAEARARATEPRRAPMLSAVPMGVGR